eukprot:Pgem_evm1s14909
MKYQANNEATKEKVSRFEALIKKERSLRGAQDDLKKEVRKYHDPQMIKLLEETQEELKIVRVELRKACSLALEFSPRPDFKSRSAAVISRINHKDLNTSSRPIYIQTIGGSPQNSPKHNSNTYRD